MTTRQRTVVRQAPGKLFVAGEYAVVEPGNPAILVAVDRQVTVTVSATSTSTADVVISSDLGQQSVGWRWHDGRLVVCGADSGRQARSALAHVVSAIETVGRLLAEHGLPVPALDVSVSSRLHEGGTKFGLGSSGAVTVAAVAAVAAFCGLELSPEARFRLAMLATAELDPKASGGDLAASTWGGWLAYQAPDRMLVLDLARRLGVGRTLRAPWPGHTVRRLSPPAGLSLEVGWTGEPASTASLVSALHRRTWRGSVSHQRFVETTTDCVRSAVAALEAGDRPGLLHQIRRARQELARLDDAVGLGIFTPKLTALCDAAEAVGGAAKPSGAGGGDCGIALLDAQASEDITHVRQRWETAGVLPLPIRPALEGIEE
ncbi:phosphomevalonate kinase [Streptomyces phaeochromogenes]|uniref:phosphomevalonate kinase n=1 Tax=Streptomyces phaeochromogenes TaxID=1923 RepID=UPI00278E06B7|nr:phosphomevalonate kinase [Streptomyces phaeochromogenes]MDQ0955776.1 phosphomevalonate kinase [Streptomyces phaeochromogenes]